MEERWFINLIAGVRFSLFALYKMINTFIYDVKAAYTTKQTELSIKIRSIYNKVRKLFWWAECETQEETYRYYKRLGVTALSSIASTYGVWLTACTAAPVVSEMCIAGLNAGGVHCLKNIWEEGYERDVFLMSYAKTFGLNFLAGAVSV